MSAEWVLQRQIRLALTQLGARDASLDFQRLCFELACVTVSSYFVYPAGPVGAGGDQGRDFETFWTADSEVLRDGIELGVERRHKVVGLCTLQQRGLARKICADAKRACEGHESVDRLLAYTERDIPRGAQEKIRADLAGEPFRLSVPIDFFGGEEISRLLVRERESLEWPLLYVLGIGQDSKPTRAPNFLPPAPSRFVNRRGELARLDGVLEHAQRNQGTVVAVVSGMPGVGKSALASRWANSVRQEFPEGALYADFAPRQGATRPDPSDVVAGLLRDLGVPPDAVPDSFEERCRHYRRLTDDRRLLMLADNVDEPAQVQAAKPSGPGSLVVAVSTSQLRDLVFGGAHPVRVEPLPRTEAVALVRDRLVADRPMPSDDVTAQLIELCAGLPLALNVCTSQLVLRPELAAEDLIDEISSAADRLQAIPAGHGHSVEATFEAAYAALPADARHLYRRLGCHPGTSLGAPIVAVAAECTFADAVERLEALRERHLINAEPGGRFAIHPLVHSHMILAARRDDEPHVHRRIAGAVVDWYLGALHRADRAMVRERLRLSQRWIGVPPAAPEFGSQQSALKWFDEERRNVLAAMQLAVDHGLHRDAWDFAEALWPLIQARRCYSEWMDADTMGIEAAVADGEPAAEARLRSHLARAHAELGDHERARSELRSADLAARRSGHAALVASVTEFAGVCALIEHHWSDALDALESTRQQMEALQNRRGVALADYLRGKALIGLGQPQDALEALDAASPPLTVLGDTISLAKVRRCRAEALLALDDRGAAHTELAAAERVMNGLRLDFDLARLHELWAELLQREGRQAAAAERLHKSHRCYTRIGHPEAERLEQRLISA
ncbi:NB-ARC domain-containing protein [Candidatus Poriferisodalis sp.]|uniref:NB-ARC domain-containing protein n=1 Tax=Candidatus Poriferisodalis sp. TaxID=3101277 RepID=UPI003B51A89E